MEYCILLTSTPRNFLLIPFFFVNPYLLGCFPLSITSIVTNTKPGHINTVCKCSSCSSRYENDDHLFQCSSCQNINKNSQRTCDDQTGNVPYVISHPSKNNNKSVYLALYGILNTS